jgi:ADP-heptose:LPS heptosyltransferase
VKILVLHPGALGDVILSLPALAALRRRFPRARITLAGNLDYLRVVSYGHADSLASLATLPLHRLFEPGMLTAEDRRFWQSHERIVCWTGAGDEEFTLNLTGANPKTLIASWKPARGESRHVTQIFVDSLGTWIGDSKAPPPAEIRLRRKDRLSAEAWLRRQGWAPGRPVIAIHPGAGSAAKRWPLARFQLLAREIVRGLGSDILVADILVIEGPAEPGLGGRLAEDLPAAYIAESLPLGVAAGALSLCRGFIGNDSGIAHLAAGLGLPSVILFGPTSPEQWAPQGNRVIVLRDIRECTPCETGSPGEHLCLSNITVERVWAALKLTMESSDNRAKPDQ